MGGADKVKRQHDGGRLAVRQRIEKLIDPGRANLPGGLGQSTIGFPMSPTR